MPSAHGTAPRVLGEPRMVAPELLPLHDCETPVLTRGGNAGFCRLTGSGREAKLMAVLLGNAHCHRQLAGVATGLVFGATDNTAGLGGLRRNGDMTALFTRRVSKLGFNNPRWCTSVGFYVGALKTQIVSSSVVGGRSLLRSHPTPACEIAECCNSKQNCNAVRTRYLPVPCPF
jgi:hypothetical protein